MKETTMRENIIDSLLLGPRTNREMQVVGGEGWRARCHEINRVLGWASVVTEGKISYLVRKGRIDGK